MENIETQTAMKTQPYVEVLKHGRGQWLAYSCPSKPKPGVPVGHDSRRLWDAFVNVAKITFNTVSFATKDAHMVMYKDEIYDQWIHILEKHHTSTVRGRQPGISTFRCLRGLEDNDVSLLQVEILEGKISLLKQANQGDMLDITARSMEIKQTKVFVEELLNLFKELDPTPAIMSWDDCRSHYNITDKIYKSLFISCTPWLELKLHQTKQTPEFPQVTKGYVQWIIKQKNGSADLQVSLPWTIKCVGSKLEGIEFLGGENTSPLPISMCILDTTHRQILPSGWSAVEFGKIIDGVCGITHQPSQFVIVGLVKYQHAASLEKAIATKAGWYAMHVLPIDSLISTETKTFSTLREVCFGVFAFFSQGEQYDNYSRIKESLLQPMHCISVDEANFDAVTMAKAFLVSRAMKCLCVKEDDQVLDVFSLGYGTKEALQQQRKVISIACSNEQVLQLETICMATIEEDDALRKWARLDGNGNEDSSIVANDDDQDKDGDDGDDDDDDLDANADEILQVLKQGSAA